MYLSFLILIAGLAVLIIGGEFLVKGAVGFSRTLRISPLVIGMTVVAFGTSAPELLVSLKSALAGNPGIAIGNVVGSNIVNISLVLGLTVLIFPIITDKNTKFIDYPVMIFATLLFYLFALNGNLSFSEGLIFIVIIVVFTTLIVANSIRKNKRKERESLAEMLAKELDEDSDNDVPDEVEFKAVPFWKAMTFLSIGLVGLYFGADWFIEGAVEIANFFLADNPNKDAIIGVTVVAFGTSAPELVASIVAAFRKQTDISIGNLIGSNIFNIFAVLGVTSTVIPIEVSKEVVEFDMLWMILIAVLLLFVLVIGKRIGRLKGAILVATYLAYIGFILYRL